MKKRVEKPMDEKKLKDGRKEQLEKKGELEGTQRIPSKIPKLKPQEVMQLREKSAETKAHLSNKSSKDVLANRVWPAGYKTVKKIVGAMSSYKKVQSVPASVQQREAKNESNKTTVRRNSDDVVETKGSFIPQLRRANTFAVIRQPNTATACDSKGSRGGRRAHQKNALSGTLKRGTTFVAGKRTTPNTSHKPELFKLVNQQGSSKEPANKKIRPLFTAPAKIIGSATSIKRMKTTFSSNHRGVTTLDITYKLEKLTTAVLPRSASSLDRTRAIIAARERKKELLRSHYRLRQETEVKPKTSVDGKGGADNSECKNVENVLQPRKCGKKRERKSKAKEEIVQTEGPLEFKCDTTENRQTGPGNIKEIPETVPVDKQEQEILFNTEPKWQKLNQPKVARQNIKTKYVTQKTVFDNIAKDKVALPIQAADVKRNEGVPERVKGTSVDVKNISTICEMKHDVMIENDSMHIVENRICENQTNRPTSEQQKKGVKKRKHHASNNDQTDVGKNKYEEHENMKTDTKGSSRHTNKKGKDVKMSRNKAYMKEVKKENSKLQKYCQILVRDINIKHEQLHMLREELALKDECIKSLQQDFDSLEVQQTTELKKYNKYIEVLQDEIIKNDWDLKKLEQSLFQSTAKLASIEEENQTLKNSISDYRANTTAMEHSIAGTNTPNAKSIVGDYVKDVRELKLEKLREELFQCRKQDSKQKRQIEYLTEQIIEKDDIIDSKIQAMETFHRIISGRDEIIKSITEVRHAEAGRVNDLQKIIVDLNNQIDGLKKLSNNEFRATQIEVENLENQQMQKTGTKSVERMVVGVMSTVELQTRKLLELEKALTSTNTELQRQGTKMELIDKTHYMVQAQTKEQEEIMLTLQDEKKTIRAEIASFNKKVKKLALTQNELLKTQPPLLPAQQTDQLCNLPTTAFQPQLQAAELHLGDQLQVGSMPNQSLRRRDLYSLTRSEKRLIYRYKHHLRRRPSKTTSA